MEQIGAGSTRFEFINHRFEAEAERRRRSHFFSNRQRPVEVVGSERHKAQRFGNGCYTS